MGVNFNYDTANNVETPTLVLTYKSGDRINNISGAVNFQYTESMKNPTEFSFEVHKKICNVWHQLETFRNVWVKEWNDWYTLVVEKNISNTSVKDVNAYHLPEYELANTKVTSEINTESDSTLADDETISTIYNPDNPKKSILDRILEPIRGFEIGYVSPSLKDLAYDFSFNNISIYDAFMEIAEQANAHFEFLAFTDEVTGKIRRVINFYDLEPYCSVCHTRLTSEETQCTNPDCLSTEIESGYGEDTSVFLSLDNILDSVTYTTNADAVKNCFKLEAGDEYMTSSILACNPNGSQYIWYMDTFIEEMSDLLRGTYENYIADYNKYNNTEVYTLDIAEYNELINKYINMIPANAKIPDELILLESSCTGYPALINVLYDVMDAEMYLDTTLMPSTSISLEPTTAMEQAENLIKNISSVAINGDFSAVTVKNAVLDMVKALIDSRYSVKITVSEPIKMESSTDKTVIGAWRGTLYIENYSNEEEFAEISTDRISELTSEDRDYITITNEYESYLTEKLNKILEKGENKNYGISSLFDLEKSIETFISELKYYGLSTLEIFQKCCDDVIAVLIDQGIGVTTHYLYNSIYVPYDQRAKAIVTEIITREQEITVIQNLEEQINDIIANVQEKLDLQSTLEKADCWTEFCLLRREDTYSNSTYISDGLSNAKLFKKANQFMDTAKKELVKSATLQHSISATLKNIFTIKEFEPFWKKFKVGNWIRVEVDEEVFKLRLIEYTFDFSDFQGMDITFSDVIRVGDVVDDTKDLISEMRSISGNYSYVERQAAQGKSSYETISKWFETGMDATMTKIVNSADNVSMIFDSAGLLGRRYIDFSDSEFEDEQMRLINNSLVFTRDNWKSVCTAVGKFYYVSGKDANGNDIVVPVYGINGEVIAGKLFIGQNLILQNISGSFTFDENGFIVKTYDEETGIVGTDRFRIDPNGDIYITPTSLAITSDSTVTIDSTNFKLEADGTATMKNAVIEGTLNGASGSFSGTITAGPDSKIGPWNISSTSIWKDSQTHGSSGGMYFGTNGLSITDVFTVTSSGKLTCTNAVIKGVIQADSGYIGKLNLTNGSLYSGTSSMTSTTAGIYLGKDGFRQYNNANAYVNIQNGVITAAGAKIKGNIDATEIRSNLMYSIWDSSFETQVPVIWTGDDWSNTISSVYMGILKRVDYNSAYPYISYYMETNGDSSQINIDASYVKITSPHSFINLSPMDIQIATLNETTGSIDLMALDTDGGLISALGVSSDSKGAYMYSNPTVTRTNESAANVRIGTAGSNVGIFFKSTASSKRYKHNIKDLDISDIYGLYNVPVRTFKYNLDYLSPDSERYDIDMPGFIAEEIDEVLPIAVDHFEDGSAEMWNSNIIVPCLLKLIQNNKKEKDGLEQRVARLESLVNQLLAG